MTEPDLTRIRVGHLKTLFDITQSVVGILELPKLLSTILRSAAQAVHAERGLLALLDEKTSEVEVGAAWNLEAAEIDEAAGVSRSTIRQVLEGGAAVLSANVREETKLRGKRSVTKEGIQAILCVPLRTADRVVGALYLDNRTAQTQFGEEAKTFLLALANLAAIAIQNAKSFGKTVGENALLRYRMENLIGQSAPMKQLSEQILAVAASDVSVVIEGESGTGKELVARAVHAAGRRAAGPWIPVNAAELSETLIESELFGHRKDAFTGAASDRKGIFEAADGGTVFLDEIGCLPLPLQAKLLRVLQEREVRRIGENVPRRVDLRLICATNRKLSELVQEKKFREDLFFRLNVVTLALPPLRARRGDVPLLAEHFLRKHQPEGVRKRPTPAAMEALEAHAWPGNVRELENAIQRALVLCPGAEIGVEHLGLAPAAAAAPSGPLRETLESTERSMVERALLESGRNVTRAAERLGIPRQQLQRLIKRYGL